MSGGLAEGDIELVDCESMITMKIQAYVAVLCVKTV